MVADLNFPRTYSQTVTAAYLLLRLKYSILGAQLATLTLAKKLVNEGFEHVVLAEQYIKINPSVIAFTILIIKID